jgi:hypothetical protein
MKRTIFFALVLTCGAAQAFVWVQAGATKDGARSFVDTSSIKVTGSGRQAWLKMTYPPHTRKDAGSASGKWVNYYLNHATFDCGKGMAKSEAQKIYYDDGTSSTAPADVGNGQRWDRVTPNTVLDTVMKFVCSWKPK